MWSLFDQWIVATVMLWALWAIFRNLNKKSFLSCNAPCEKKLFKKKPELVALGKKIRE